MLEINKLVVKYNKNTDYETTVLNKLCLSVKEKEFLVIIGGNGAGKSTLMNCLAGEKDFDGGKIILDNMDLSKLSFCSRVGMISRVFQDPLVGTCSKLTIAENLALSNLRGKKRSLNYALTKNNREHFCDCISVLGMGLENRLDEPINNLSGGQRQAVSLVMATMQPTKLLLLDEHTAALDPKSADMIMEITNNTIKRHNLTTIMITHDMQYATAFGNRLIVVKQGQVIKDILEKKKKNLNAYDLWHETHQ